MHAVLIFSVVAWAAEPDTTPTLPSWYGLEFVQSETSRKMVEIYEKTKKQARPAIESELQEIQRELELDEPRIKTLQLAAEGALEQAGRAVRGSIMSGVEGRTKGATAVTIKKVLAANNASWSMSGASSQPLWRAALAQVLTAEEQQKLTSARDERQKYREKALAMLLEQYVVERVGLAEGQLGKLRPLLLQVVKDYLPDMSNYYNDGEGNSIYSEMVPVMVLGVEEKAAKDIISDKAQWERWQMMPGQYKESWNWIKRNHETRLKREEKK
ncbi:MAG: hypothetical protein JNJ83_14115 [Verrucomicrobiaceae bacterium]|nr:hypothetical protein [Verrucomicrobiaceae bacterium]